MGASSEEKWHFFSGQRVATENSIIGRQHPCATKKPEGTMLQGRASVYRLTLDTLSNYFISLASIELQFKSYICSVLKSKLRGMCMMTLPKYFCNTISFHVSTVHTILILLSVPVLYRPFSFQGDHFGDFISMKAETWSFISSLLIVRLNLNGSAR